jgi:hypothetical protein
MQVVKAYTLGVTDYTKCMQSTDGSPALLQLELAKMRRITDKFNAELRAFKALQ